MNKMNVLAKLNPAPGLNLSTAEIPSINHDDVLIKIKKTAICGTDLHIYSWDEWAQKTINPPMHVGHEFVGEIVELGKNVSGLSIGDKVSGEGHLICRQCRNCRAGRFHLCRNTIGVGVNRPGAFAEYLSIPAFNTFKMPEWVDDDIASFFDPFGNAVHTALSFKLVGEDVLIVGAGPIGMMAAAVCRHVGAKNIVVVDINDYRLNLAKQFGVTEAVNVSDCKSIEEITTKLKDIMSDINMKEGFDVGLEFSGNQNSINAMINVMNTGGKLSLLGLSGKKNIAVNWDLMVFKSLMLKGIYGREMFDTWYTMTAMLQQGLDLSAMVTHKFKAHEFELGFSAMKSGNCGKVVLDW